MTTSSEAPSRAILARLLEPAAFGYPRRLTPVSAWDEHIPFAMALISVLRPRVLVELGTHAGDSYCAFCQAVVECSTETRCFAVDTWRGDPHAGEYGEEVLSDLRSHHDPLYGGFSQLLQSTFQDALGYFEDGAIDLLHIDGLHTYEAVRGDFESWRPKLSPRAVVLFHDTNVRERDFGVWRLWSELTAAHPHFEFAHGHGLGVLAAGDPPETLRPLFEADEAEAALVRRCFSELGRRLAQVKELRANGAERDQLRRDVEHRERDIAELRSALRATEARLAEERAATDRREDALGRAQARVCEAEARAAQIEQSRVWAVAQGFRSVRDAVAPSGSMLRSVYDRVLRARR